MATAKALGVDIRMISTNRRCRDRNSYDVANALGIAARCESFVGKLDEQAEALPELWIIQDGTAVLLLAKGRVVDVRRAM